MKYGRHFFHPIYASRLLKEAYGTYLPSVENIDVTPLLRALEL